MHPQPHPPYRWSTRPPSEHIAVQVRHQSFAGPHILTSAMKPLVEAVYATIESFVEGSFTGGENTTFGVQDLPDAALLAPYTADVPQEVQDAVAAAQAKLVSGEVDPPATLEEVGK